METSHEIVVLELDAAHRQAIEEVIGAPLGLDQRLVIRVTAPTNSLSEPAFDVVSFASTRPPQSLSDWAAVYEGLTDEQIDAINRDINTRANLTRGLL